jgi:hypothetical protein
VPRGTCAGGVCTLGTLVDDGDTVAGTAVDANAFYVALSQTAVERCSIAGCVSQGPTTLYTLQPGSLVAIAASTAGVFWTGATSGGGGVVSGCSPTACASGSPKTIWTSATWEPSQGIAADATNVYWPAADNSGSNDVEVLACPAAGCAGGPTSDSNDLY